MLLLLRCLRVAAPLAAVALLAEQVVDDYKTRVKGTHANHHGFKGVKIHGKWCIPLHVVGSKALKMLIDVHVAVTAGKSHLWPFFLQPFFLHLSASSSLLAALCFTAFLQPLSSFQNHVWPFFLHLSFFCFLTT